MENTMKEVFENLAEQAMVHVPGQTGLHTRAFSLEKFAELIVKECVTQCEQVATDANAMTKSKFVTDAGLVLHEGAWGGAKNCSEQIKLHFGVEE
jgi:hypothetical protein